MPLFAFLLVLSAIPALAQPPAKPAAALPVKAVPAKLGRAVLETGAVGSLRADESVLIRERIAFAEGQGVRKGALLATLDAAETRAVVASSSAR